MICFRLIPDSGYTKFTFPIAAQKTRFEQIVKEYFRKGKSVLPVWENFILRRGEPQKTSNIIDVDGTGVIAFDEYSYSKLSQYEMFNDELEFLPINTDVGEFKVLNVLKFVDCLNKDVSKVTYGPKKKIITYKELQFLSSKLNGIHLFKIPELPHLTISSFDFLQECEANEFKGLEFDFDVNKL